MCVYVQDEGKREGWREGGMACVAIPSDDDDEEEEMSLDGSWRISKLCVSCGPVCGCLAVEETGTEGPSPTTHQSSTGASALSDVIMGGSDAISLMVCLCEHTLTKTLCCKKAKKHDNTFLSLGNCSLLTNRPTICCSLYIYLVTLTCFFFLD